MKQLLITIAAVLLVGCGKSQRPTATADLKPVVEGLGTEPPIIQANQNTIHRFAYDGNIEVVKKLLADGVNVNTKEEDGGTALHWAANEGHKEIVELLITSGADVNISGPHGGGTALHFSANEGHKEIAEILITKGADINAKNDGGETPLDWATDTTADLLRKHGAKTGEELKAEGK